MTLSTWSIEGTENSNINIATTIFSPTDTASETYFLQNHAERISIFIDNPSANFVKIQCYNGNMNTAVPGDLIDVDTMIQADYHNVFLGPISMVKIVRTGGATADLKVTLAIKL